jgi:hypothetical protein
MGFFQENFMQAFRKVSLLISLFFLSSTTVIAQTGPVPGGHIALRAARLIDGKNDTVVNNAVILVENDKIARRHRCCAGAGKDVTDRYAQ